jgi:two-component system sensor histidine kinase ChvG
MFLKGILSKILSLMVLFNLALWAFIFFSDDAPIREINAKRNQLFERSNLFVKMVEPIFEATDLSPFARQLAIEKVFRDKRIVGSENLILKKFVAEPYEGEAMTYFNGINTRSPLPIQITELKDTVEAFTPSQRHFDPFEKLFIFYKNFFDLKLVTDPFVERHAKFTTQFQLLNPETDLYELTYLLPIKVADETVATLRAADQYYLREAYLGANKSRLIVLLGLSLITIIFGLWLAISIAMPIRRLSRKLNKKIDADTVVEQLGSFRIDQFENRKDEVGLLYRNLNSLHEQIIQLFNDKERFAADVSHELKNPLASIIANSDNAIISAENSSTDIDAFKAIRKQAIRMNKLISEISEAAIVDYDLVAAKREKFDLSEALENLVQFFENQNSHVSIISSIQKNVMFLGLPDRIARIFINLIENAVSFAGENGQVCVTLKKSWRHGIIVTVEDSGPGVPESSRDDIFERFFSARQGSAMRENSSGLGLYICKQVVEAHEGIIEVLNSDTLGGALFRIRF